MKDSLGEVVKAVKENPLPPPWQPPDVKKMVKARVGSGGVRGEFSMTGVGTAFGIRARSRDRRSNAELNRQIKLKLRNAELELKMDLYAADKASQERVAAYTEYGQAAMEVDECEAELTAVTELGKELYCKSVAFRNVELAQLGHERRLRRQIEQEFAAAHFPWYALLGSVFPILRYEGFSEASQWRSRCFDIISA